MNKIQVLEKAILLFENSTAEQKENFLRELKTELSLELSHASPKKKATSVQLIKRIYKFLEKKDDRLDCFRKVYKLFDGRWVISNGKTLVIVYKDQLPVPECYESIDEEQRMKLNTIFRNVVNEAGKSADVEFITSKNLKRLKKVDLAETVEIHNNVFRLSSLQQICDMIGDFKIYPGQGTSLAYFENDVCVKAHCQKLIPDLLIKNTHTERIDRLCQIRLAQLRIK